MDRLERLTNLVLELLRPGPPRPLAELAGVVPGYPPPGEARRQAFERDKRTLRDQGIAVSAEPIDGPEQVGYRIRPEDFYLPDLDLGAEEQVALNLAVAAVPMGDGSGRHALWRLGLPSDPGTGALAELPTLSALPVLFEAIARRATVSFEHRGVLRQVAPVQLQFRQGRWYLAGFDLERQAVRTFRVDRVAGAPVCGEPGSATVPAEAGSSDAWSGAPWQAGDEPAVVVDVWLDEAIAGPLVRDLGPDAVVEQRDGGAVVVRLTVTNLAALRSWLLDLGERAEVLGPARVRADLVAWLRSVAEPTQLRGEPTQLRGELLQPRGSEAAPGGGPPGSGRDAGARLRRLLAVLAVLAREGRVPLDELAGRFGVSPAELASDLELAACCGLPPYTPDQLMEIVVDGNEVEAFLEPALARPRRLTAVEGLALSAAARAILAVPGADPEGALRGALEKLDQVLAIRDGLRVELDEPEHLAVVRRAVGERRQLAVRYHSAARDEVTQRVVDPLAVLVIDGHWYLDAYCHRAGGLRRFRVDRMLQVAPTGACFAEEGVAGGARGAGSGRAYVPSSDAVVARLVLDSAGSWVLDAVPVLFSEPRPDGRIQVDLAVSSPVWLGRLLLRLGPHATVVSPPELATAGATVARRILRLYEEHGN